MRVIFKKLIPLAVSFAIGLSAGVNIKVFYESSIFKPYEWKEEPKIVNCYGKEFSKLQMTRAISYWTMRGYNVGEYVHSPTKEVCKKEWINGTIILRKSHGLPENTLASTRRYSTFMAMKGAVIWYRPGSYNLDLLNEHELGHALGFAHLEIEGHIMHPAYHKMGRDFWIPASF